MAGDRRSWCKVASNLDSHPKIRRAGRNGREVFLFALRRNAEPGNDGSGSVAASELEPWYLADQLMMSESEAKEGLDRCLAAGLLRILDGERVAIGGWDEDWGRVPMTGSERTAKWRKHKAEHDDVTSGDADVTAPTSTSVTRDGCDAGEERRGEEIKEAPESFGADVGVEIPSDAWVAADTLRTLVLKAQPTNAIRKAPWGPEQRKGRRKAWANEFRLLLSRDGRTTRELGEVLRFLFNGQTGDAQFVVLSPATLREKWDRITTQMQRVKRGGAPGEPAATIQISPEAASRLTAQPARPFLGITVDDDENGEDFA
ncbi:MAG TPA: hypothetical protein VFO62_10710 [Candidatus Binatia bacterium]|nr:hypothetical protein [Candidatus Binatia bacterium]